MTEPLALSPSQVAERLGVVYRFYNRRGDLLYVGMTSVGPVRWTEHAIGQPWWPEVAHVKVVHFATVAAALASEACAIQLEDPRYNVIHKHAARARRIARPYRPRRRAGSVYQRTADGRWVASVSRGARGERRTVVAYRDTEDEAERALAELLA